MPRKPLSVELQRERSSKQMLPRRAESEHRHAAGVLARPGRRPWLPPVSGGEPLHLSPQLFHLIEQLREESPLAARFYTIKGELARLQPIASGVESGQGGLKACPPTVKGDETLLELCV